MNSIDIYFIIINSDAPSVKENDRHNLIQMHQVLIADTTGNHIAIESNSRHHDLKESDGKR